MGINKEEEIKEKSLKTAEKAAKPAEKAPAADAAAKPAPKKKKNMQVLFRAQNAASAEVKNMAKTQKPEKKAPEPEKKMVKVRMADGTLRLVDSSKIIRKPKPVKKEEPAQAEVKPAAAPETERPAEAKDASAVQPAAGQTQEKPAAAAKVSKAEQPESVHVKEPETKRAESSAVKPAEEKKQTKEAAAAPDRKEKPADADKKQPEKKKIDSAVKKRTIISRIPERAGGDKNQRTGGKPFGRPNADSEKTSDSRKRFDRDKKPAAAAQAEAPAAGTKKQTGRASGKAKDKNKDSLRENKYINDKSGGAKGSGSGKRQMSNLPKALQKPVHKAPEKKDVVTEITLPEKITIRELAERMKMQPAVIVKKLFLEGTMVTVNQEVDFEKAQEIALTFDIIAEPEEKIDVIEELLREEEENEEDMITRPPVVCVMGHVDHGKTSLLDAIRHSHVTDREAGGITQHIGAYVVPINGQKITFLDTPGHEAFTAMRMRGANSTDIAILVVAADDGVMPQTVEAINHAKAAGVEIIVAINKIDKPGANIDRVKQELMEHNLIAEDWGGTTVFAPVSAKTGEGIDNLLEMILLTAEVLELKANPNRKARGLVLEAKLDKGKGPVANVLVQKGTLKLGDYIAAGSCSGRVRAMMDENSRQLKQAGPSTPVEILGLNGVPNAGEIIMAFDSDKEAKNFAATFVAEGKNKLVEDTRSKMSLDDLFNQIQEGNLKELNIVVKADVQGSVEAIKQSLIKLSNDEVVVKIIHGGVGAINESDVTLAATSNAIVIGFNVRPDAQAKAIAEEEGVDMRLYRVIYQAIEDVENAMKGMLEPIYEEKVIGHVEIRQIFKASGIGNIAGSYVLDGTITRDSKVRITRGGELIYEGALASLKRFKDDVKEVKAGFECGLVFDGHQDIAEFDQVEAYIMVEVPRT